MSQSSLPTYPALPARRPTDYTQRVVRGPSRQAARILLYVAVAVTVWGLVYLLRQALAAVEHPPPPKGAAPPRPPLDFKLVQERYDKVLMLDYGQVVGLLGPPSPWSREPEFQGIEQLVAAH